MRIVDVGVPKNQAVVFEDINGDVVFFACRMKFSEIFFYGLKFVFEIGSEAVVFGLDFFERGGDLA